MFIDLEYAGYNFQAYDLADNLNESCFDYAYDKPPYFKYLEENEINEEKMIDLTNYFLYFNKFKGNKDAVNICKNPEIVIEELKKVFDETTL